MRWEADAYDAGMDAGAADAGTTTTEVVTDAGAADAGDHAGEHCVETAPARGCGLGGGGASAAGLLFAGFALRRRPGA